MTQLDLPPISFAHYLDLLKRRRWQVIPVSVLGLVIGALVAFLIPRYYVVGTKLRFNNQGAAVLMREGEELEDVLFDQFDSARITIPASVEDLLRKLQWPEALNQDPDRRQAFVSSVRDRVEVKDLSPPAPGGRGRKSLILGIGYRDTDGFRAVELITKLIDTWIEREKQRLLNTHAEHARKVNEDRRAATVTLENKQKEKQLFEEEHGINPEDWRSGTSGDVSLRTRRTEELQRRLTELKPKAADHARQRARLRDRQDSTPKEITRKSQVQIDPALRVQLDYAQVLLLRAEMRMKWISQDHPNYALYLRQLDDARAAYALASSLAERQQTETLPNPEYEQLYTDIEREARALALVEEEIAAFTAELARRDLEGRLLPQIYREYASKVEEVRAAEAAVEDLDSRGRELDARLRVLTAERPYDILEPAWLPPRPTDPNITIVALTGSLLGLGVAIVLILLADMMRTTFKTVDDVARGLPVPVLGVISYMETTEQRAAVGARRTRMSLLAFGFLILIVAIVVVYYVAPARLPQPVFQVLDLLLGEPKK